MNPQRWQRIQEAFHAAEGLEGAERQRRLSEICGTDHTLRRQVESLLVCGEGPELDAAVERAAAAAADPEVPASVGNYRLVQRLGEGGMGVVYEAEQQNPRRRVALKLIRAGPYASDRTRRLFQREVEALGRLKHSGIATIYESGAAADGQPFLAMELVKGVALQQWFERQAPLPSLHKEHVRGRIGLFRSICDAIGYAHQHGVIHRDIKPSNIMVLDGAPGEAAIKVLDFGLARFSESTGELTLATAVGVVQGSVPYMSPEQARGENDRVDLRSDVYALGVLLYWLLTAHHPYLDKSEGLATALARVAEAQPKDFRAWDLRSDQDLELIVRKALEKDPERRYQSVAAFTADLDRYLEDLPVDARAPGAWYQLRKLVRRHRWGVASAAAFVLLLAVFGLGMSVLAARATRERDAARRERARSDQVSVFLTSLFGSPDPFRSKGNEVTARQLLDQGARRVLAELRNEPQVRAKLLNTIAESYQHLGAWDRAEDSFRAEIQALEQAFGPGSLEAARVLRELADVERQRGRTADAERDLRQALAIHEKLPPGRDEELSHTLNNLSIVLQIKGDLEHAEAYSRKAVEISRRYPDQIRETLTMMSNLGSVLAEQGKSEDAEAVLREVLLRRREILGDRHPQVPTSMRRLATMLAAVGRYREAEQLNRGALERFRALVGPDHPDSLNTTASLASVLCEQGEFAESEALYRDLIARGPRVLGETPDLAAWSAGYGWLLFKTGRAAEGEPAFRRALETLRSGVGPGSLREARILARYAVVETATRHYDEARAALTRALEIYQAKPASQIDSAQATFNFAELNHAQGRNREAEERYARSVALDRSAGPAARMQLAAHLLGYAGFLAASGSATRAEPLAREALAIREKEYPPGFWMVDAARSVLGGVLARLGRYSEAETLLAAACAGLNRSLGPQAPDARAAAERAATLYRASGTRAPAEVCRAAP
jgi:serine/threonine protein kinase/Tfp pilus assembly protein PilF